MSSGLLVNRDMSELAPQFAAAVQAAVTQCNLSGFDAFVYEGLRSDDLQRLYYSRGRTIKPPHDPVTNSSTSLTSWHGYGFAVDVISRSREWGVPPSWFASVAEIFLANGCKWGGHFSKPDYPHFQWGQCRASPSSLARQILAAEGKEAVWRAVGAM